MNDDFFSLKMLIVSEAAPERELVRQAAARTAVPTDVTELEALGDPTATGELLARENYDVVFFDSRIPRHGRQELLDAIRAAPGHPLAVLIGSAAIKTREVLTDGLAVDS